MGRVVRNLFAKTITDKSRETGPYLHIYVVTVYYHR